MIHVHITAELQADEDGPHDVYTEKLVLPEDFARDAEEAHERILTLLSVKPYFELRQISGGVVPLGSRTVREVWVWEEGG